jgi:predicted RNA methylase
MRTTNLFSNRLIEKAVNTCWELRLGVRTRGFQEDASWITTEHVHYGPTSYPLIFRILDFLALTQNDVVVDLGCGKGRVVCCAARYRLVEVIGVEDVPILADRAEANATGMRGRKSTVSIARCKAQDFDYARGTVYYLNNPFGPQTLNAVLKRLEPATEPGRRLVYFNPVHEAILEEKQWLERYAHWPASPQLGTSHPVSFWRTRT